VAHPAVAVLEYHLAGYRRGWQSSLVSSLLIPVLYLLGLGLAVAPHVDRGGSLGRPYLAFVAPGLLAATALQVSMLESSFPVLNALRFQRTYQVIASTPVRVVDMLLGRLCYIALRVAASVAAFLVVLLPFGVLRSPWALAAPAMALLVALAAAAPMLAIAATFAAPSQMTTLVRLVMLPMTLTSGVFFPVERMPEFIRPAAYALPLWHGVELSRAAALGIHPAWPVPLHLGVLALWLAAGFAVARARFSARLAV